MWTGSLYRNRRMREGWPGRSDAANGQEPTFDAIFHFARKRAFANHFHLIKHVDGSSRDGGEDCM